MIIWGTRGKTVNLGNAGTKHCEVCEKERQFNYLLQYRYFHLYYLFGVITQKEYLLLCDICNRGWKLDTKEVEQGLGKNVPIPFMHRYGLFLLFGSIGALIVSGTMGPIGVGLLLVTALAAAVYLFLKRRQTSH